MSALAELDDLRVKFGPVAAVRGVSLEVMPGEVVCLLGESGSGKSVTMRALMRACCRRRRGSRAGFASRART